MSGLGSRPIGSGGLIEIYAHGTSVIGRSYRSIERKAMRRARRLKRKRDAARRIDSRALSGFTFEIRNLEEIADVARGWQQWAGR